MARQFTTQILLPADPTSDLHAATKAYTDAAAVPEGITPATVLNLGPQTAGATGRNHFLLQSARVGDSSARSISQSLVAGGFEESPYFTCTTAKTAVQMQVAVGAPPTSGSSYARCELRELDTSGANMGFDALDSGTHRLHGRTKITHLMAVKPEIVIAQLHNGSSDRVAIRTQLVSGTVRLRVRINGSTATLDATSPINPSGTDLVNGGAGGTSGIVGVEFEWKIELVNGTARVYVARTDGTLGNMTTPVVTSTALVSTGSASWYFKAGVYLQSQSGVDGDSDSDYGSVELRDLQHWHTGWPTNAIYYPVAQHAATHLPGGVDDLAPVRLAALGTVSVKSYGALGDGTTDDTTAIQAAINATPAGGVCHLPPGTYRTSSSLVVPPQVTLQGSQSVSLTYAAGPANPCVIKPVAAGSWTGTAAVIRLLSQTDGGYSTASLGQRLRWITIDGSANTTTGMTGVQLYGFVREAVFREVTVRNVVGDGFATVSYSPYSGDAQSAQSCRWLDCVADNCGGAGFNVSGPDCLFAGCNAQGSGYVGFLIQYAPNTQVIGCRAEWSGNHNYYLTGSLGTGQGSGGVLISGCTSDRANYNGLLIDSTGSSAHNITGFSSRRDGRNGGSGGGNYAGIQVTGATNPVMIDGYTCYPGVNDDGSGTNSPQFGVRAGTSTYVAVDAGYIHAATAATSDAGGNTYFSINLAVGTATGTTASPTRVSPPAMLDTANRLVVARMPAVDNPTRAITYAATITPDASTAGNLIEITATGALTIQAPTNGTNFQKLRITVLASGADRVVTFAQNGTTSYIYPAGKLPMAFPVPSGQVLVTELVYTTLLGTPAWILTSAELPGAGDGGVWSGYKSATVSLSTGGTFFNIPWNANVTTVATTSLVTTAADGLTLNRRGLWSIELMVKFTGSTAGYKHASLQFSGAQAQYAGQQTAYVAAATNAVYCQVARVLRVTSSSASVITQAMATTATDTVAANTQLTATYIGS